MGECFKTFSREQRRSGVFVGVQEQPPSTAIYFTLLLRHSQSQHVYTLSKSEEYKRLNENIKCAVILKVIIDFVIRNQNIQVNNRQRVEHQS